MGLTGMTVGKWRKRYRELGFEGLHDEPRPGMPAAHLRGRQAGRGDQPSSADQT